jgi:hypothetical protein
MLFSIVQIALSQKDLESILDDRTKGIDSNTVVEALFKGTRIINGHSVKSAEPGEFIFLVTHRFGEVKSGWYDFFGLDQANTRIGLDFGIADWLSIGIGRSSYQKTFDGFFKSTLLNQKQTNKPPFTLTYLSEFSENTIKNIFPNDKDNFIGRLSLNNQMLAARKFSPAFSLQIAPTFSYTIYDPLPDHSTTLFANGFAARYKLTTRITVNAEYYHILYENLDSEPVNPLAVGVDIETGGHVFQLHFTNTQAPFMKGFLSGPNGKWLDGEFYFGFNITRLFAF